MTLALVFPALLYDLWWTWRWLLENPFDDRLMHRTITYNFPTRFDITPLMIRSLPSYFPQHDCACILSYERETDPVSSIRLSTRSAFKHSSQCTDACYGDFAVHIETKLPSLSGAFRREYNLNWLLLDSCSDQSSIAQLNKSLMEMINI